MAEEIKEVVVPFVTLAAAVNAMQAERMPEPYVVALRAVDGGIRVSARDDSGVEFFAYVDTARPL